MKREGIKKMRKMSSVMTRTIMSKMIRGIGAVIMLFMSVTAYGQYGRGDFAEPIEFERARDRDWRQPRNRREVFSLYLNVEVRGLGVINLQEQLRGAYPHVDFRELDLVQVAVSAKSRLGEGVIQAHRGNGQSGPSVKVPGNPFFFDDPRFGWARLDIPFPQGKSGPKQLDLEIFGNVRILEVFVTFEESRPIRDVEVSCTFDLRFHHNRRVLRSFTERAVARHRAEARALACERAERECLRRSDRQTYCSLRD